MKIRLFSGKLLISLIAFLLFASSELPSSSKAEDGFWLTRSQSGLEQLWSGVLGCTESTDSFAIRNRFNDSEDTNSGAPSTGASIDYSECGKRALRNTSSRILVDTIEDAVRSGGVALFSEHFRLDSSVGWVFGEDVTGEIDAVIPLFSRERSNGTGQALFLQPGAVFWSGLESEDRIDANLGLAYRQHLAPDIVAGGSIFYDYDFKREHQRLGIGADLQRGAFHAALNYYHPLNEWQEGRTEYEEQPLQGADFRLGLAWSRVRLDAGVGVWRFEGEEEESTKWRPSFEFGAGYLIYPGVFLQGGYERHDSDDSLDSRWNAELAFRFSLPDLQGVKSYETKAQANLWEPVEREKRILYEEREAVPPVRLSAPTGADGAELTSLPEEGDTITIVGNLEALSVPVMLELVIDEEASSADLGDDFRYGHKVYELDAATGQQSAPSDATICPASRCEMMIPARVTRFDVEIEILSDSVAREIPEEIVLEVEVPEEYQRMVRGGARTVGIQAHGNTVQFTEAMSTLDENGGMVDVAVNANLASPSPITLNVTATSTDAVQGRDYTFPSGSLTIPANPDGEITSASLRLTGINNDRGEGSKTITLTIPDQSLPTGWTFGTQTTHTVTLQDDDLAIFFTDATPGRVDEPASDQSVMVTVGITQAPVADITVNVAVDTSASTAQASDYSFTTTPLTFSMGSTTPQTATLMINHDMDPEGDETVVLTLADDSTNSRDAEGSGFSLGSPHTITIPANDNTVGFASNAVATLGENGGTARVEVSMENPAPVDITLNVSATDDTATVMIGRDYRISTRNLTISRGQTTGTITLTGINNERGEGSKDIDLTLSVVGNLPNGWAEGDLEHKVTLLDDDL
ncbi:MAG: inverse autotransporter beta domain-containing protein, partial [Hyphomicrobiales bacterium]|nr:inverse autotransporter beta domain-containing protein [Hyphomicrobiales bacterium]